MRNEAREVLYFLLDQIFFLHLHTFLYFSNIYFNNFDMPTGSIANLGGSCQELLKDL